MARQTAGVGRERLYRRACQTGAYGPAALGEVSKNVADRYGGPVARER